VRTVGKQSLLVSSKLGSFDKVQRPSHYLSRDSYYLPAPDGVYFTQAEGDNFVYRQTGPGKITLPISADFRVYFSLISKRTLTLLYVNIGAEMI
jgi:hypothetical protein